MYAYALPVYFTQSMELLKCLIQASYARCYSLQEVYLIYNKAMLCATLRCTQDRLPRFVAMKKER